MKSPTEFSKISKKVSEIFNKSEIEELAHKTGFVVRKRMLSGLAFMQLMVFELLQAPLMSLNEMSGLLLSDDIRLSRQSLDERMNDRAVAFMRALFSKILLLKLPTLDLLDTAKVFQRILIKDGTVWQLPENLASLYRGSGGGASKAGIKVHLMYNLKGMGDCGVQLVDATSKDTKNELNDIKKGDLLLTDLGYFDIARFAQITRQEAYFISRYRMGICVYDLEHNRLDLAALIRKMHVGEIKEMDVYLGNKERLKVRLVLEKVPPELAAYKRRKLKYDKQNKRKSVSKERLEFCDANAYITNVSGEVIKARDIRSIYALRWQIEIMFKTWKSTYRIDSIKQLKAERFLCMLYGRLIIILLQIKLFSWFKAHLWNTQNIELSELKSLKFMSRYSAINKEVFQSVKSIKNTLDALFQQLATKCRKEKRKKTKTPMQILSKITLT